MSNDSNSRMQMPLVFLVTSRYTAPPETIAEHLPAHRMWLNDLYERGLVLLSGRLGSGDGGFMLMQNLERPVLDSLLATDPFRHRHLLEHAILDLAPNRWCAALNAIGAAA